MATQSKLKHAPGTSDDVKQMYEILKKMENNEQMDSDSNLSDDEDDELDSDDEEDLLGDDDLSKRLEGIDLNDADAIWSKLTEGERQEFDKIVQSEDVTSILPKFSAWWEKQIQRKLVTELNGDEKDETEVNRVEHPKIVDKIVDFARISTRPPASCILNNLTNVLASYTSMVRFFYGEQETSKHEAISYLMAVCANLRTNANFDDTSLAIESIRQDALNEGYSIDESDLRQMKKDVDHLMAGSIQDKQNNVFVLAALSDLHRLFSAIKIEMKSKPMDTSNQVPNDPASDQQKLESEQFSKRFNDRKVNSCQNLDKGKLTAIIKKLEYYLAYVSKYH